MGKKIICILLSLLVFFIGINGVYAEDYENYAETEEYEEYDEDDEDELPYDYEFYEGDEDFDEDIENQDQVKALDDPEINPEVRERLNDEKIIATCKKEKSNEAIISCCSVIENEGRRDECYDNAFKVCSNSTDILTKQTCCEKNFDYNQEDKTILNKCKYRIERYCTPNDNVKMNRLAMNIKVGYEPFEEKYPVMDPEDPKPDLKIYMLDLKVYNMVPELTIVVKSEDGTAIAHNKDAKDGVLTFRNTDTTKVKAYQIDIISNDVCMDKVLRTINITLPKYNEFSEREICTEVPTYYLCQQYITYDIDSSKFLEDVKNYKEKAITNKIETADSGVVKKNTTAKIVTNISKNKYLVVGIVLVIGIAITFAIVLINKKKKEDDEDEDF